MICLKAQPLVQETQQKLIDAINRYKLAPRLDVLLIGNLEASLIYVERKRKAAQNIGIDVKLHRLPESVSQDAVEDLIRSLNLDATCTGILVQLPLPKSLNVQSILNLIDPLKDVDGFHPFNKGQHLEGQEGFIPCTALGISRLLSYYSVDLKGKHVLVLGRSAIVGKPVALECLHHNATVTVAHSASGDLTDLIAQADIIISATGQRGVLNWSSLKKDQLIIDVGIHREGTSVVGDLGPKPADHEVAAYTPVPGGVGLMTVNTLMLNTIKAYCLQHNQAQCWQELSYELEHLNFKKFLGERS